MTTATATAAQGTQTPAPGGKSTVSTFDAARRAQAVKDGQPGGRMAAPSCLRRASVDPSGSFVVPFWMKGSDLMVAFPGESPKKANPESITTAFHGAGMVAMPVDRLAQKVMVRTCERAGDAHRNLARQIEFAVRLPMSSKLIVLADALARKFWIQPTLSAKEVTDWCTAFGMIRKVESLHWLAGQVFDESGMTGKQTTYRTTMFEAEDKALEKIIERGAPAAMASFEASNTIGEAWGAYERIDTILRYRYLVTGEVARVTPINRVGSDVTAKLSTPFKVREGEVMVVSESDSAQLTRSAKLVALGFDDVHGLIGTFGSIGSSTRRGASDAIPTMIAAHAARESVLITGSPFLGSGNFTPSVFRWATQAGAEKADRIERDVPLDVSLAGAPTEG